MGAARQQRAPIFGWGSASRTARSSASVAGETSTRKKTPGRIGAVPTPGRHTDEVLTRILGYDRATLDELRQEGDRLTPAVSDLAIAGLATHKGRFAKIRRDLAIIKWIFRVNLAAVAVLTSSRQPMRIMNLFREHLAQGSESQPKRVVGDHTEPTHEASFV
jgi:hypothetical protein